jgi:tetratricopeptide (TPR) repeat protein
VDSILQAPAEAAAEYVAFRRGLLRPDPDAPFPRWRKALHDQHIDLLILYDVDSLRLLDVYGALMRSQVEWELVLVEGSTAVFAWHDPERIKEGDRFARLRANLDRLAFAPSEDKVAPAEWAGRPPHPAEWWDALTTPRLPKAPERDEAAYRINHFDLQHVRFRGENASAWGFTLAAAGTGAGASGTLGGSLVQALEARFSTVVFNGPAMDQTREPLPLDRVGVELVERRLHQGDDGAPALLFMAIRAARRALHDSPDDPETYLVLGEAYTRLLAHTRERAWGGPLRRLRRLREVQAAGAFNQALLLKPDMLPAHMGLFNLYEALGYKDLSLKHLRDVLRLTRERGGMRGDSKEQAAGRVAALQNHVRVLGQEVQQALDLYEINSQNLKIYEQAYQALEKGLAGKALEVLLAEPDVAGATGARGVQLELDLLLGTGRLREVREWMAPGHEEMLGRDEYHWLRAQLEAASGNYEAADLDLAATYPPDEATVMGQEAKVPIRTGMALTIGENVLDFHLENTTFIRAAYAPMRHQDFLRVITDLNSLLMRQSNTAILQAVVAIESGNVARAKSLLGQALALWGSDAAVASGGGVDFDGRPVAQRLLELLTPKQ